MKHKTALITGASRGLGRATAIELAKRGARVVLLCRDEERGNAVADEIRADGGEAETIACDLTSLGQVRSAARDFKERFDRLDLLVNNAAVIVPERRLTEDNLEETFVVNYLSHFVLTVELLELLEASATPTSFSRVVNVSSEAHRDGYMRWHDLRFKQNYSPMRAYAMSKLAVCLFTRELARRLGGTHVTATALHPGRVATGFGIQTTGWRRMLQRLAQPLLLTPESAAQAVVHLATAPELEGVSGKYFVKGRETHVSAFARDEGLTRRIWTISEHLAGIRLMEFAA